MNRDLAAGSSVVLVGASALFILSRMPPDGGGPESATYVPRLVSWAIVVTGLFIAAQSLRGSERMAGWAWRPFSALVLSVLVFGLLIERGGLVVSSAACALVGSLGAPFPGWPKRIAMIVIICAFALIIFKYLLGLNLSVGPAWTS